MNESKKMVLQYRKLMKRQQKEFYDWFILNAKEWKKSGDFKIKFGFNPKAKECYYNAQKVVLFDNKLGNKFQYYEGWAVPKDLMPMQHAWLVQNGKVFDPTWKDGTNYYGLEIPSKFITEGWIETEESTSMLLKFWQVLTGTIMPHKMKCKCCGKDSITEQHMKSQGIILLCKECHSNYHRSFKHSLLTKP